MNKATLALAFAVCLASAGALVQQSDDGAAGAEQPAAESAQTGGAQQDQQETGTEELLEEGTTGTVDTEEPAAGTGDTGVAEPLEEPATTDTDTQPGQGMQAALAQAEYMLDAPVRSGEGNQLGEVEDLVIDPASGEITHAVIASGGFLGIGRRRVAVEMDQLVWDDTLNAMVATDLTEEDLRSLEPYEPQGEMTAQQMLEEHPAEAEEPAGATEEQ